jgi:site-specific recombinase XerD
VTIKDATDLLSMEAASRRLSQNTLLYYKDRCRVIQRIIGDKRIDLITATDLRRVMAECSPGTVGHNYRFLARLFRFLINEEVLEKNPMAKLKPPKVEQKVIQPLSAADVQKCYKLAKSQGGILGIRDAAIFATLVSTGIRREELCTMTEADVRLNDGVMLIRGKGNKQRFVPIPVDLLKLMAQYLFHRRGSRAEGRCDRFFKGRNGAALVPSNLTLLLGRLGKKTGVHLHPHRLRHTYCTMFMSNDGADVLTLQAIAGWSTLAMANRYVKPTQEKMQRSMDAFSPIHLLK